MAGYVTDKRRLKGPYFGYNPKTGRIPFVYQNAGVPGFLTADYGYIYLNQTTLTYRSSRDNGSMENDSKSAYQLIADNHEKNLHPFDTGHEFHTTRVSANATHRRFECRGLQGAYRKGPLLVPLGGVSTEPSYSFAGIDLTKGSRALRATMPTKSAANLSQALLELVVDLPQIPFEIIHSKSFRDFVRNFAGGYVGASFAWKPLVDDVIKWARAIERTFDILNQYEKDSGKQIRRSFDFEEEKRVLLDVPLADVELSEFGYLSGRSASSLYPNSSSAKGDLRHTDTLYEKYWFAGAWMYHLYEGETVSEKMNYYAQLAKKLLGVKLDLELLWEIAPWSWLADWFANIGDIISINTSIANDNLVLRYGYLMRNSTWERTSRHTGVTFYSGYSGPITHVLRIEDKQRVRSTPYGFGLNTDGFSPAQWTILVALGLAKQPKQMAWG